jgi:pSer/pThr/pTyr-binding forkhead associated (FHA) protein
MRLKIALLIIFLGLSFAPFRAAAQAAPEPESPPPDTSVQPVRISNLRALINQAVLVEGIVGQRRDDPATSTRVYSLVDDYNDTVWVRTKQEYPPVGTRYRVEGIVTVNPQRKLFLIESNRSSVTYGKKAKPAEKNTEKKKSSGEKKQTPSGKTLGLALIALALVGGLGLYFNARKQAAKRALLAEQQRLAREREREQRSLESQPRRQETGTSRVPVGGTVVISPQEAKRTQEAWGSVRVTSGPHSGLALPLLGDTVAVGRDQGELQLPKDQMISSRHGVITVGKDGSMTFTDSSRNGSRVDGEAVHNASRPIKSGTVLELGGSRLELVITRSPGAGVKPPAASSVTIVPEAPPAAAQATGEFLGVELLVTEGPDKGKRYPVGKSNIKIGRREDQDLRLSDEYVSREHAQLSLQGGTWRLKNISSRGTTVNGETASDTPLKSGDKIVLGSSALEFHSLR